jgi:hypothetical protein
MWLSPCHQPQISDSRLHLLEEVRGWWHLANQSTHSSISAPREENLAAAAHGSPSLARITPLRDAAGLGFGNKPSRPNGGTIAQECSLVQSALQHQCSEL